MLIYIACLAVAAAESSSNWLVKKARATHARNPRSTHPEIVSTLETVGATEREYKTTWLLYRATIYRCVFFLSGNLVILFLSLFVQQTLLLSFKSLKIKHNAHFLSSVKLKLTPLRYACGINQIRFSGGLLQSRTNRKEWSAGCQSASQSTRRALFIWCWEQLRFVSLPILLLW